MSAADRVGNLPANPALEPNWLGDDWETKAKFQDGKGPGGIIRAGYAGPASLGSRGS